MERRGERLSRGLEKAIEVHLAGRKESHSTVCVAFDLTTKKFDSSHPLKAVMGLRDATSL